MGFDSVVFADRASLAALSCFSRLAAARDSGRKSLIIALVDIEGAEAITSRSLAEVRRFEDIEAEAAAPEASTAPAPWRERFSVLIRRLGPTHVVAPLGLLGAPQTIDYFATLRAALSVDTGRDLLFFEERPHCLVLEAVALRLSSLGVRLPPATEFKAPRSHPRFTLRMVAGMAPPIFGSFSDRFRLSRALKTAFRELADWDPQRALGPKLQPVTEPWSDGDTRGLLDLAGALGQEASLGSPRNFGRRQSQHAASARSRTPIERCWLSLPGPIESDPGADPY